MSNAVRTATPADIETVRSVLDSSMLASDSRRVRDSVRRGETVVAVSARGTVIGALVRDGQRIVAIAVRRRRRGQGIGTALVERASTDADRLVAAFDPDVRPFYEALGFAVEPLGDGRLRGVRC